MDKMPTTFGKYTYDPQGAPMPMHMPNSHVPRSPQLQQTSVYSSQIIHESGACSIYRYNANGDTVDQSLHQIVSANGKVYVECIPGHSIIYMPSTVSPAHVVTQQFTAASRVTKSRSTGAQKAARPSNVFFKYRSHKLPELQARFPKYNQTVLSRMVAEHWRAESDSVKDHFKQQYKDEMIKYEVSKKLLRYNASSSTSSLSSSSSSRPVSRHSSEMPVATEHLPAYSSYNSPSLPVDYDAGTACQNQRSPFLPAVADKPQHDISRLIH